MFRNIEFFERYNGHLSTSWWMYLLLGLNFVFMALLIFIFPEFLAYLIAAFLLLNGVLMMGMAFQVRSLKRKYKKERGKYWIDVQ